MKIEFLVSTTNRINVDFLQPMFCKVGIENVNVLVVNQCFSIPVQKKIVTPHKNIRVISIAGKGLAKSRNVALKNAFSDICVIADDDVIYESTILKKIQDDYQLHNFDVVTYRSIICKRKTKKYKKMYKKHTNISIMSVASIQITFKLQSIVNKGIVFDERFGVSANCYITGEENIFMKDCMARNLACYASNYILNHHPDFPTGSTLDQKHLITKGAVFSRMFDNKYVACFVLWIFFVKKIYTIVQHASFGKSFVLATKEIFNFRRDNTFHYK